MKEYCVSSTKGFSMACGAIRSQVDAIYWILMVTRYLSAFPYSEISCGLSKANIVICVEKMSRLFLVSDNKIHCLHYPFSIRNNNQTLQFYFMQKELNGMSLDIINAILKQFETAKCSIDNMFDCFFDTMDDFSIGDDADRKFFWNLLLFLLTQEYGYLRYDHDPSTRSNATFHPIDHIDFFYSTPNTFKVGLKRRLTWLDMKEIMDVKSKCSYLR